MKNKASALVEQQLLAATIDQLPVGAFVVTAALRGGIAVSNRKMRELWGSPSDDVLAQYRAANFSAATFHL